jgi:acyl-coenzyme A thioesterase PaaI-like protein
LTERALQDQLPHNHCFGCGPDNVQGLKLKSYWSGHGPSTASFTPRPHHCSGPRHFVNGGIIAMLIDCHCICTATAAAYFDAGRQIGSAPEIHCATAGLTVHYDRPTPIDARIELTAEISGRTERGYLVGCTLSAAGKVRVRAEVEAVRVPDSWMRAPEPPRSL